MRIRHGDLHELRSDPTRWARKAAAEIETGEKPFRSMSYGRLVAMSAFAFHKRGFHVEEAVSYLNKLAQSYPKLVNQSRLDHAEEQLRSYIEWCKAESPVVAEVQVNILFKLASPFLLGGEVSRIDVDMDSGGYRAVLLSENVDDWASEERMPLIQLAVAEHFHREPNEVSVGVQRLDGSDLQTQRYPAAALKKALRDTRAALALVAKELAL